MVNQERVKQIEALRAALVTPTTTIDNLESLREVVLDEDLAEFLNQAIAGFGTESQPLIFQMIVDFLKSMGQHLEMTDSIEKLQDTTRDAAGS